MAPRQLLRVDQCQVSIGAHLATRYEGSPTHSSADPRPGLVKPPLDRVQDVKDNTVRFGLSSEHALELIAKIMHTPACP